MEGPGGLITKSMQSPPMTPSPNGYATPESEAPLAQPTLPLHQQLPDPVVPAELTEDNDTVAVQEDPVALVHRFLNLMGTRQQECQAFREKLRQIHDKYYAEIDRLAYHYMMGLPPV
ncbi:hypothetical protein IWQ60_002046 [Tieghemiomyces parasiticus]|uniref:Uncharacterized protein n=1 Tax=Tieghemiomyces parasiticus TaxID=78921 RepID=A0A9W8ABZ0_9FUNG|nr:hypothetical protein IWQ60_002046 [Tieghemiomyces parasiticus]